MSSKKVQLFFDGMPAYPRTVRRAPLIGLRRVHVAGGAGLVAGAALSGPDQSAGPPLPVLFRLEGLAQVAERFFAQ